MYLKLSHNNCLIFKLVLTQIIMVRFLMTFIATVFNSPPPPPPQSNYKMFTIPVVFASCKTNNQFIVGLYKKRTIYFSYEIKRNLIYNVPVCFFPPHILTEFCIFFYGWGQTVLCCSHVTLSNYYNKLMT